MPEIENISSRVKAIRQDVRDVGVKEKNCAFRYVILFKIVYFRLLFLILCVQQI